MNSFFLLTLAVENKFSDQTPFNYMIWNRKVKHYIMPETYKWSAVMAPPSIDLVRRKFCEPGLDGRDIEIMHMVANSHKLIFQVTGGAQKHSPPEISIQYGRKNSIDKMEIPKCNDLVGRWVLG